MVDENELEKFRLQWKNELQKLNNNETTTVSEVSDNSISITAPFNVNVTSSNGSPPRTGLESSSCCDNCGKPLNKPVPQRNCESRATSTINIKPELNTSDQGYFPFVILDKFLKDGYHSHHTVSKNSKKRKYFEDEELLIHDGSKSTKNLDSATCVCSKLLTGADKKESNLKRTRERYLDIFIADLDEITEIPFFDTTVPRELGIKIFCHLDMKTLCRCSQVSRSWHSLADDNLLWCQICRELGYDQDVASASNTNWKQVVRDYIQKKKTLISNWKGRLGKIIKLEYPQGGVVCSVHSCKDLIVAGYSGGQVKLWDVGSGSDCTFQPSSTALVIDPHRDEGTIHNYVLRVATSQRYTAAAYKHGFVDIWDNLHGTSAISTIQCEGNWGIGGLELRKRQPWLALSHGYYVQIHQHGDQPHHHGNSSCHLTNNKSTSGDGFVLVHKLDLNQMVKHIRWLESDSGTGTEQCMLAVATDSIVNVYRPDQRDVAGTEIHNVYNSPISCIDLRPDPGLLAVGCGLYGGPSETFRVKLYDLATKELLSTLQGHTWIITCLNLSDSPPNHLVTGNGDRRVRIYDMRCSEFPIMVFTGHSAKVSTVMMDDWKVVSGDEGGFVCVWDQRMSSKLWEWHNRHPVQYSCFDEGMLVVGNVPYEKFPDSDFETVPHRRLRGSVQVYDFSADVTVQGVPEICHSTYDEPEAYDFNIRLAMPYDKL